MPVPRPSSFSPVTIIEPTFVCFRPGVIRIGILRTLRFSLLILFAVLVTESFFLRWDRTTDTVAGQYLIGIPFVALLFVALPRRFELRAESVITSKYGEKFEHRIIDEAQPILLVRPLQNRLNHVALIFPTGSGTLMRIVPIFDCVVRDSDLPALRSWADHDPQGHSATSDKQSDQ